ncbi:MAG: hypothetical protein QGH94_16335, partial [Phycisphaerae bacterium]|nr:hypothetical protein [Phycisphaerae bacterium]
EMIESVTKAQACPAKADQAWSWDPLMVYQGHDPYMVPFRQAGNFLGGVTTPAAIQTGRGLQLVADYCGPWNSKLVVERAEDDLTDAEKIARKSIRRNLRRLVRPSADGDRYVVYNPGPAGTKIVRIKGAGKKSLAMCGKTVAAQEVGRDLLVLLSLPTNGYVVLEHHEGSDSAATPSRPELAVGQDYLENALLRAEFDLSRGTVKRLVRKSDGRDLLADGAHGLYLADDDRQECRRARLTAAGPIRGTLEFDIEVGAKRGNTARIRSRISLDAGQSLLGFQEHVVRCPQIRGDQWINHLGVRFWPADRSSALMRCYFNVLEPAEKERVFSNNLLVARGDAADVLFVNHGNQFYRCSNNEIGNILLYEQERAREFAYAVGFPRGNPVIQARAWTSPLFAEKVARKAATNENRSDDACVSFFSVDSTDVEITSCRYVDGRFLLRLANTTGQEISAVINAFCGIGQAVLTDLCGNKMADLEIRDRGALVPLRPWDIRQVALTAPA